MFKNNKPSRIRPAAALPCLLLMALPGSTALTQDAAAADGTAGASAESRGIEANVVARPSPRLEFSAAAQWLHARFREFVTTDPHQPGAGPVDQKDHPLLRAPDLSLSLAMRYSWLTDHGRISLRSEGSYRSRIYFSPFRDERASAAGMTLWNVALSWETSGRNGWHGAVFVRNLANKTYPAAIYDPQSLGYLAWMAPGRTVGMNVGHRY